MKNKKEAEKAKNKPEKLERIFPINIKKLKIGKIEKKPFRNTLSLLTVKK
jgi:hypothetical protein